MIYYVIQILMMVITLHRRQYGLQRPAAASFFHGRRRLRPRYFASRGERLSYSNGIKSDAHGRHLDCPLQGNIEHLISLYAIGVFLSFTIAQSAMVVYRTMPGTKLAPLFRHQRLRCPGHGLRRRHRPHHQIHLRSLDHRPAHPDLSLYVP